MNRLLSAIRRLCPRRLDDRGNVAIEFGLTMPILVFASLAILEFGLLMFEHHRANEATRRGARQATMVDAVADLTTLDPANDIQCTATGGAVDCGAAPVYSAAAFGTIVAGIQSILPNATADNVVVLYRDSGLGAAESGGIKPFVTVRLVNYKHEFITLGAIPGVPAELTLPDFATTQVPGGYDTP